MLKIITWLPIALLFSLQASAQHPVVQRVIQKDPQLLIERQQNENSYIVAIATDPNTRTSYL
ncbi:MAG: hypothetical protein JNM68_15860, partial [Dinghuibacter sp.]|nr:hypothetical protein [Dinghuibacter sp.]